MYSLLGDILLCLEWLSLILASYILITKSTGLSFKFVYTVLFITVIAESSGAILTYFFERDLIETKNNLYVYNVYQILVFPLLLMCFYCLIVSEKRRIIPYFICLFMISFLIEGLFFVDYLTESLVFPNIVGSTGLCIVVMVYFTQILEDGSMIYLKNNFYFWLSCGILIYYVGNVPFSSVINFMIFENQEIYYSFFYIRIVLAIMMYTLICIGLPKYNILDE